MIKIDESEEISRHLSKETNKIINNAIGKKVSSGKKEQLVELLTYILHKSENKLLEDLQSSNYYSENYYEPITFPAPKINIIFYSPSPPNFFPATNQSAIPYYQPQIPSSLPFPNYFFYPNYSSYPIHPNFMNYLQPTNQTITTRRRINKKRTPKTLASQKTEITAQKAIHSNPKKVTKTKTSKSKDQITTQTNEKESIKEIKFESDEKCNGIISFLSGETGGNIHHNGTIEVTASSIRDPQSFSSTYDPQKIIDNLIQYNRGLIIFNVFFAPQQGQQDFWLCFDFKEKRIQVSSYTISNTQYLDVSRIRNWVIEISNDGKNWSQIDKKSDCHSLEKRSQLANFTIESPIFAMMVNVGLLKQNDLQKKVTLELHSLNFLVKLK